MALTSVVIYDVEDVAQAAMVFESYSDRSVLIDMLTTVKPFTASIAGDKTAEQLMNLICDDYDDIWVALADNEQDLTQQWSESCTEEETLNMLAKALDRHLEESLIDEA